MSFPKTAKGVNSVELGEIIKKRLGYLYLEEIMNSCSEHTAKELKREYVEKRASLSTKQRVAESSEKNG